MKKPETPTLTQPHPWSRTPAHYGPRGSRALPFLPRDSGAFSRSYVGSLLLTLLAVVLCVGCSKPPETTESSPAVPVEVVVMQPEALHETAVLTGILAAYRVVDVVSEVTGTIESLHKDVGDRVRSEAILATVNKDVSRQSLRQAEAAQTAARARYLVAHSDFLRDSTLHTMGDISESAFEIGRMTWKAARADLKAADATRELAARQLRETDIRAPFAGYVSRREVELGSFVSPGMPLFRIVDMDSLRLILGVSQRNIPRVQCGMEVQVRAEAFGARLFHGRVRSVSPEADKATRTFPVEVILDNPEGHPLKDGMIVRAGLTLECLIDVIAVAREAVLRQGDREFVFVVEDSVSHRRDVRTGRMVAGRYIIEEGLRPGDRLVTVGLENLREGSRVLIETEHTGAGPDSGTGPDSEPGPGSRIEQGWQGSPLTSGSGSDSGTGDTDAATNDPGGSEGGTP